MFARYEELVEAMRASNNMLTAKLAAMPEPSIEQAKVLNDRSIFTNNLSSFIRAPSSERLVGWTKGRSHYRRFPAFPTFSRPANSG